MPRPPPFPPLSPFWGSACKEKVLTKDRYHDENTKLEDLTHPEDIEHFKKHEEMEAEEERLAKLSKQSIVEENIPSKFRRT